MNVAELVKMLSELPQDLPVMVDGYEGGAHDLTPDNVIQADVSLFHHHEDEPGVHYYGPHAYNDFPYGREPNAKAVILARPK